MKQALITGIGGGLGSSLCQLLLSHGWQVHGLVRSQNPQLEELSRKAGNLGSKLDCMEWDMDSDAVPSTVEAWLEKAGTEIDLFVHLAAPKIDLQPMWKESMESLDRHWRVGVRSAEIITRKLSRGMARRNACMIFVLSSATLAPVKGLGGYTVAKFGLLGLAHVLLKEHGPHLRVACLSPSLMDTPMLQDLSEMARTMMLEGTSGKRFVPTDFLAQQILDLYETGDSTPELRNLLIE